MRRASGLVAAAIGGVVTAWSLIAAPQWELTIDASPSLHAAASRVEDIDYEQLAGALARADLERPPRVHVTLIAEDDSRAKQTPAWFVGVAVGRHDIVIFPERVSSYPYDSIESVLRHEIVHLALDARAGGRPLPRWFHEGTAVSVESGWDTTDRLRLLIATATEPAVEDVARLFESPTQPHTTQAYLLSAALVDAMRRTHGATLPGRIAAHVAGEIPFARAFEMETGETPNQAALHAWRSYRRWTSWAPTVTSPSGTWSLILGLAFATFFVRLWQRARRRRQWDEEDAGRPKRSVQAKGGDHD